MRILGINLSHNASIAQVTDGKLDLYFEEDRFNKVKESEPEKFPEQRFISIDKYIIEKPDYVIYASLGRLSRQSFGSLKLGVSDQYWIDIFNKQLSEKFGEEIPYFYQTEHHLYHACSAFYFSELDDALCIVMDGGGVTPLEEFKQYIEIESVYIFDKTKCIPKYKCITSADEFYNYISFSNNQTLLEHNLRKDNIDYLLTNKYSSGMKFKTFTHVHNMGQEVGKIMGLASYGNLTGTRVEDLARQLQEEALKDTIELITLATKYSDSKNIILSGGYALNCVNNYHYMKHFPEYNFFVDPAAHDGGTAVGAALWFYKEILETEPEVS
jgi:carbamoyltransferase